MDLFGGVYKGKRVLVTGHTGFKGSWLSIWLRELGADVIGYSLDPATERDNFVLSGLSDKIIDIRGDLRNRSDLENVFDIHAPDIVFHLAAQPLVRRSYENPIETYETNVMGTLNVLECIRQSPTAKIGVMITTDKCYENREQLRGYRECDPMGGYDPYSSSKGACEIAIASWRRSFFNPSHFDRHKKSIASARAGNVIGGGDWASDRIIPDCIRALEAKQPIDIRNPNATRPWEHVLEPLSGYLLLGAKMIDDPVRFAQGWNFGPQPESIVSVRTIARMVVDKWGHGEARDLSDPHAHHEANLLSLDVTKARVELGWQSRWSIDETIAKTVEWYKCYLSTDVYKLCCHQIHSYSTQR